MGKINCDTEASFCKGLGIYPRRASRVFVYSYAASGTGSLVEYSGDLAAKSLKTFCQEHLPRFSKRVSLDQFNFPSGDESLPTVMLLSTKKDTPVIWRALSGLYQKRFLLYDAQVIITGYMYCGLEVGSTSCFLYISFFSTLFWLLTNIQLCYRFMIHQIQW